VYLLLREVHAGARHLRDGDAIRISAGVSSLPQRQTLTKLNRRITRLLSKRWRKRAVQYSILLANVVILLAVMGFVIKTSGNEPVTHQSAAVTGRSRATTNPLDQLSSADIAINVAISSRLALSSDDTIVSKPQIVSTGLKSIKDLITYTVQPGEALSDLAARFYVTSDSIRWSNNLANSTISAGQKLYIIPTINGVVYDVKAGDTADTLASKFHANRDQIVAFNDDEITGLVVGSKIMIPNGTIQVVATPAYSYSYSGYAFGSAAIYGFNGYDPGNCTWYAAGMRAKIGNPIPANLGNAESWLTGAQAAGLAIGRTPRAGAIIWDNPNYGYFHRSDTPGQVSGVGHVGFVDSVDDAGAHISGMNVFGLYSMRYEVLSADQAANYWYIY
jgi:surface antigen